MVGVWELGPLSVDSTLLEFDLLTNGIKDLGRLLLKLAPEVNSN